MAKVLPATDAQSDFGYGDEMFVMPEEGRRQFDEAVRERVGISGEEFIRRFEAGEYDDIADREGFRHIGHLIGLISFARQNT